MSAASSANSVRLVVLTCEAVRFEGDVQWVEAPLADGLIGIWPEHVPLTGELGVGTLRYAVADQVHELAVPGGVLHVREDECAVLLTSGQPGPQSEEGSERLFRALESALQELRRDGWSLGVEEEQSGDAELDSVAADRSGE